MTYPRPVTVAWGDVPEWFAAVGTVGAFGATWWVIYQNSRTRQREQYEAEWDEAQKVWIATPKEVSTYKIEDPNTYTQQILVAVTNDGRRDIYKVNVILMVNQDEHVGVRELKDIPADTSKEALFDRVEAAFNIEGTFRGKVTVGFDDVAGRRWMKDSDGHLIPSHRSPTSTWRTRHVERRNLKRLARSQNTAH